jgi:hypothetical protein
LETQKKTFSAGNFALKGCAGGQLQFSDLMRRTYYSCKIVELSLQMYLSIEGEKAFHCVLLKMHLE